MSGILKSLGAVRIFVDDLDRARHFYRDIRELHEKSARPEWAVFDVDGKDVVVEALAPNDAERDLVGRFLAVSFTVDDIEAAYRKLSARGVSFPQPPEKQAWGGTLAFPRDPDGNVLTLAG
jgi:catechol 2,3-dioxygenase-like lactoylglutathione lyase family enzyme